MRKIFIILIIATTAATSINNTFAADFITSIPEHIKQIGAEDNELLKLGYLDVTLYGADPTGKQDSTAAIQQAVNDARKHQLVTFFPHQQNGSRGIYLVSDTIDCRMRSYAYYRYGLQSNVLVGSTKNQIRPLIKLKSNSAKFSNPSDPQPVFWFWSQAGHWEPKQYHNTVNPLDNDQDISFDQIIRGIDIDLGGNPGAIGIKNPGAQGQAIENVTIHAQGAFAGLGNLAGLGAAEYDVTVIGGRYGIYIDTMQRTLSPYNGKVSLVGCSFIDQEEAVIRIVGRQPSPVMLAGFLIENKKSIPFNIGTINSSTRGGFTLVSGIVDVKGGRFIRRENKGLYLRDVYFRGVNTIVDDWTISNPIEWTHVKEFSANCKKYTNLIDGRLSNNVIRSKQEGLTHSKADLIKALVKIHQWNEWNFPSFEDNDVVNIKNLGARGDGYADDTATIQQAIENYEKIFLPKGIYLISRPIVLKENTKIVGSSKTTTIIAPHPDWKPETEAIMISTASSASGTAMLADMLIGNHGADKNADNKIDMYSIPKSSFLQADQYNFTPLEWRVGRYSILRDVISGTTGHWIPKPEQKNNFHRFRVNGHGGGRWFSVYARWRSGSSENSRGMLIENTTEPMYVYPVNFAMDPQNVTIEIKNSKNKYFFYPAFEGGKTTFRISNSSNIAVYTSHKNNIPKFNPNRGIIEVNNSTNVLVSMFNTNNNWDKEPVNHLLEILPESTLSIRGANVGLYKKGILPHLPIVPDADGVKNIPKTQLRIKQF